MKKIIVTLSIICTMLAFTACGKKLAFVDTATEVQTTEAPTTEAPTTEFVTESPVIPDVMPETTPAPTEAPTTQAVTTSPYANSEGVATVLAIYNNPEYDDMYAMFDSENNAVVVFVYGETSRYLLECAYYPEGSAKFNEAVQLMDQSAAVAQNARTLLLNSGCYVDVWIVYSTTNNVNVTDLWTTSWIGYSCLNNEWELLTD